MIDPSTEVALILRRIPRNSPIKVSLLEDYVRSDVDRCIKESAVNPYRVFHRRSILEYIYALTKDGTLNGGYSRNVIETAVPHFVSLSQMTQVCLPLQPVIQSMIESLPLSEKGVLDLMAQEG